MARKVSSKKTPRNKKSSGMPVESIRHTAATRKNIPTEELREFVRDDDGQPKAMLYPRDPSLDPQLVWKGKDEQDAADLAVPITPIYIQEKIHPQAIVEDIRARGALGGGDPQLDLFADFNGIDSFEKKTAFYQHDAHWTNRMILGDSLLAMTSLAEKEGLKGQVQTIYFDPPYGIKFGSNWQVSTRKRDVKDGKADDATRQPEQVRAFRDTWELGIHSYLAYLRDRLVVARELLTETGSVFVQIGDENLHLVRSTMDEVFSSSNFASLVTVKKTSSASSELLSGVSDYVLWYAKDLRSVKYRQLYFEKAIGGLGGDQYSFVELPDGKRMKLDVALSENGELPKGSRVFRYDNMTSQRPPGDFPVTLNDRIFRPGKGYWKTGEAGMATLASAKRLAALGNTLCYVRFIDDFPVFPVNNLWDDTVTSGFGDKKVYVVQTNATIVERCLLMTTDPGDLVLDPTCGSGTTAYVAEQWGRRWITLDTSRVALALARTRLMAARYPYYLLADSPEGVKKEGDLTGQTPPEHRSGGDIRKGFVYRRVPHVTLKSIANNPDIVEGMTREQIDAAIARHADTETLYDQPYEDKGRVRVTGPFTVESLSPHRSISVDQKRDREGRVSGLSIREVGPNQFGLMIIENLKKAGVQNRVKGERLKFDALEPHAGEWIQAAGSFTDKDGRSKRAAVCIGPEFGTVDGELVKEAAKEAVRGLGFDLLVVCGFAFDPHAGEESREFGKLEVVICRMNPDLAMGDELLKKTGAGNLFMVFGEPDIAIEKTADGEYVVKIRGVDVYDPTTGAIRSNSTDDIACWFVDTDYDEESFFVRQAYFLGADEPYEKLKKALRAEVDEGAWSALYSDTSLPFPLPSNKKRQIAVKVINHYGDEVLKVYRIGG